MWWNERIKRIIIRKIENIWEKYWEEIIIVINVKLRCTL